MKIFRIIKLSMNIAQLCKHVIFSMKQTLTLPFFRNAYGFPCNNKQSVVAPNVACALSELKYSERANIHQLLLDALVAAETTSQIFKCTRSESQSSVARSRVQQLVVASNI